MSVIDAVHSTVVSQKLIHSGNRDFGIPVSNIKPLIKLMVAEGATFEQLLTNTQISPADLTNPNKNVSIHQYLQLILNSRATIPSSDYALRLGEQFFVNYDGVLACRVMCSENALQAMELLIQYQALFTQVLSLDFEVVDDVGVFSIEERIPLGAAFSHFVEYAFAALYSLGRFCLGKKHINIAFEFDQPPLNRQSKFEDFFNNPVKFNASHNRAYLPLDTLSLACVFHDEQEAQANEKLCQQYLTQIRNDAEIIKKVKAAMREMPFNRISLESICDKLHISSRSLRRHLQDNGSSFTVLLENERKRIAEHKLNKNDVTVEKLAEQLGYQSAASFSRAFKRWYGVSPIQFRQGWHET